MANKQIFQLTSGDPIVAGDLLIIDRVETTYKVPVPSYMVIDWTSASSNFSTSGTVATGALTVTGNIVVTGTVDGRDIATDGTKLDGIEELADVTDETNVVSSLSGATLTAATIATSDKVLIQDADDLDNLKTVTVQNILDQVATSSTHIDDSDFSSNGLMTRTASGTYTSRTLTGTANEISVADGDGVSGNPTLSLAANPILTGNASLTIPYGTDAQRPGTPATGMIRGNTTSSIAEYYNGADWLPITTTQEVIEDYVGGMVSGNTETLISVTYDDINGKLDFAVDEANIDHDALTNFVANEHIDWTSTTSNFSTSGTAATGALTVTGNIGVTGTVDGRDIATDGTKLDGIEELADVTDETNVIAALDGATISSATVATNDKVLIQDADATDALKYVTAQSIADLAQKGSSVAFHAYRNAVQSIPNTTLTKVQFNNEEFDTNSNFDSSTNYRFTPTIAGKYLICFTGNISGLSSGNKLIIDIYKNGTGEARSEIMATGAAAIVATTSKIFDMNGSTDYIEGYIYQDSGSSQNTTADARRMFLAGILIP